MKCGPIGFFEWVQPPGLPSDTPSGVPPLQGGPDCYLPTLPSQLPGLQTTVIPVGRRFAAYTPATRELPEDFFGEMIRRIFRKPEEELPFTYFRIEALVSLPIEYDSSRRFSAIAKMVLGEEGTIGKLEVHFTPPLGPVPPWFFGVPIVAPQWPHLKALWMDPETREVKADLRLFVFFSKTFELGKMVMGMLGLKGSKVPEKISDLVTQGLKGRKRGGQAGPSGMMGFTPRWDKGQVDILGDFSNRTIEVNLERELSLPGNQARMIRMVFGDSKGERHRFTIRGPLDRPTIQVWGLKAVEYLQAARLIRVTNDIPEGEPMTMTVSLEPDPSKPPYFSLNWKQRYGTRIEEFSRDGSQKFSVMDLPRGAAIDRFHVTLEGTIPKVSIGKVEAEEVRFEGYGIKLNTRPGPAEPLKGRPSRPGKTLLTDVRFEMTKGLPKIQGTLSGQLEGNMIYTRQGVEVGKVEFRPVEGKGTIRIGPREEGRDDAPAEVSVTGEVSAILPSVQLGVESDSFYGKVNVRIEGATVTARGKVTFLPESESFEILAEGGEGGNEEGVVLTGARALVLFSQETLRFVPQLARHLTEREREKIRTELHMEAPGTARDPGIRFTTRRMILEPAKKEGEKKGAPLIREAALKNISIHGDMWGRLYAFHVESGVMVNLAVEQAAKMEGAVLKIGRLVDRKVTSGTTEARDIEISGLELEGIESKDTLTAEEQARCDFQDPPRRQHLHAKLGLFGFRPEVRELRLGGVAPHFHINLIDAVTRSCLKVFAVPAPDFTPDAR